eukprot:6089052-Heterocapsa_arctica.AAC.1
MCCLIITTPSLPAPELAPTPNTKGDRQVRWVSVPSQSLGPAVATRKPLPAPGTRPKTTIDGGSESSEVHLSKYRIAR